MALAINTSPAETILNSELPASITRSDREALEWFTLLQDPPLDSNIGNTFEVWCTQDPENLSAYLKIHRLWNCDAFNIAISSSLK
jgi:ferric-dicitrate binding protein FerR (iron transport regulator)